MHEEIKHVVDEALISIKKELQEKFPEEYAEKFQAVMCELAKIKEDKSCHEGHKYFYDVSQIIDGLVLHSCSESFDDAIATIGLILDGRLPLLYDVAQQFETKEEKVEFVSQEREEVYTHLIGIVECGVLNE